MNEPTMFEIARRLDDVSRDLRALTTTLEERYVPRREYELRVGELEKDATSRAGFQRQVTAGALLLLLGIVANIIISIGRLPGAAS